jgi:DNA topoisomerase-2
MKNTDKALKFDQFRGYVGEVASYNHGEMSLNGTIYGMNHDFVGSNNINLLCPVGQLGSRLENGADAAAPRYVSTKINPLTRLIFKKEDTNILTQKTDDGFKIEPGYYLPVIPLLLVNNCVGIATGFAINLPSYNPVYICKALLKMMKDPGYIDQVKLIPWYKGFNGTVVPSETSIGSYISRGVFRIVKRGVINVEEIPIGVSISNYKLFLEKLLDGGKIGDFVNRSTDVEIDFTIKMDALKMKEIIEGKEGLCKFLGLEGVIKRPNINCFDERGVLQHYDNSEAVLLAFFEKRLTFYDLRYKFLLKHLKKANKYINAKVKFINGFIEDTIKIARVSTADVVKQLTDLSFPPLKEGGYEYLIGMRLSSLTLERIQKLENELATNLMQIEELEGKTPKNLWEEDVNELLKALK